jgi:hypothetical protein
MKSRCGERFFVGLLGAVGLTSLACAGEEQRRPAAAPEPPASSVPEVPAPATSSSSPGTSSVPDAAASDAPARVVTTGDTQPVREPTASEQGPAAQAAVTTSESPSLATLRRYYADLNGHRFEANRYFASSVKNYITMRRPSASAIDHYLREVFPKQFESYEFLLDESTLREESPNVFTFIERSRYYLVKSREFRENLAQVRVEFDADGKIVDFRHTKVLAREKTPELNE